MSQRRRDKDGSLQDVIKIGSLPNIGAYGHVVLAGISIQTQIVLILKVTIVQILFFRSVECFEVDYSISFHGSSGNNTFYFITTFPQVMALSAVNAPNLSFLHLGRILTVELVVNENLKVT